MKVLVADDHALIREAFRHLLAELKVGVTVLEAADCDVAFGLIEQHPDLDLLLLDLRLPGGGGQATLEKLRVSHPSLPVVIVSAYDDASTVRGAMASGAMGFVPKSSSNDVMISALRLVLAGGRYLPPEIMLAAGMATVDAPSSAELPRLTDRQREVLGRVAQGKSNKQICRELGLAEATVKIHITAILRALKVTSRAQAIVAVNQRGLLSGAAATLPVGP
ncbi:MAG: response regulator transcription factor [Proteobacteria bacterium]|nr:response regulator transcription factor [Pseudomonadota bacterium]